MYENDKKILVQKQLFFFRNRSSLDATKGYSLALCAPKGSEVFYNNLINKVTPPKSRTMWDNLLNMDISWPEVFAK